MEIFLFEHEFPGVSSAWLTALRTRCNSGPLAFLKTVHQLQLFHLAYKLQLFTLLDRHRRALGTDEESTERGAPDVSSLDDLERCAETIFTAKHTFKPRE